MKFELAIHAELLAQCRKCKHLFTICISGKPPRLEKSSDYTIHDGEFVHACGGKLAFYRF